MLDAMIAGLPAVASEEVVEQRDSLEEEVDERIFEEADSLSLGI